MKKMGLALVFGFTTIIGIIVITSFIFSLILKFTNLQESSVSWILLAITFLALFIGGFVSGGKGKVKGWLSGGATGLLFTFIVFIFQYLGYDQPFTMQQLFYHIGLLVTAMMGGIIGVNMFGHPRNE
jgi:putative membrane protein (TIGR04086 family)